MLKTSCTLFLYTVFSIRRKFHSRKPRDDCLAYENVVIIPRVLVVFPLPAFTQSWKMAHVQYIICPLRDMQKQVLQRSKLSQAKIVDQWIGEQMETMAWIGTFKYTLSTTINTPLTRK